jgi:hypothetical protein
MHHQDRAEFASVIIKHRISAADKETRWLSLRDNDHLDIPDDLARQGANYR